MYLISFETRHYYYSVHPLPITKEIHNNGHDRKIIRKAFKRANEKT